MVERVTADTIFHSTHSANLISWALTLTLASSAQVLTHWASQGAYFVVYL